MSAALIAIMANAQNEIGRLNQKKVEMIKPKSAREKILRLTFLSYNEAERSWRNGYITDYEFFLYKVWWHWGNYRMSSPKQDVYFEKYGLKALTVRINHFRSKLGLRALV